MASQKPYQKHAWNFACIWMEPYIVLDLVSKKCHAKGVKQTLFRIQLNIFSLYIATFKTCKHVLVLATC